MTNVTCGLTAKKPGLAPSPTFVIQYGTTFYIPIKTFETKREDPQVYIGVHWCTVISYQALEP